MTEQNRNTVKREVRTIFCLTVASAVIAFNLKSFVETGGLFPGGFSGVTILIQETCARFFDISLPYSAVYLPLNLVPAYLGVKYISKRFTFYSFYVVVLSGLLTDVFPSVTITYDTLLISIFGGIINGFAISLCLYVRATSGGTDFIAIALSERKNIDAWNYILCGNVVMLMIAGLLFGWDKALYSILFQYASTQMIRMMDPDGRRSTLLIVAEKDHVEEICALIRQTHHSATLMDGVGMYNGTPCTMIYSVVEDSLVRSLSHQVRQIDPKAFVNVLRTEKVVGKFYRRPRD